MVTESSYSVPRMPGIVKAAQRKVSQMNFVQVSKSFALISTLAALFGAQAALAQDVTGAGARHSC